MKLSLLQNLREMDEQQLYAQLYTDHLTGAMNRRALDMELADDVPRSIAIIDMDSLKYVNDTFGHRTGDTYLCDLVGHLRVRFGSDNVYRLGGDEFAVVQSGCTLLGPTLRGVRRSFPGMSYGVGCDLAGADSRLELEKKQRERDGLRAKRGECPPWLTQSERCTA